MHKSRYSPISVYISDHEWVTDADNDTPHTNLKKTDDGLFDEMGCSKRLAHHILGLFKRSPIPAYANELNFEKLMNISCCTADSTSSGNDEGSLEESKESNEEWWTKIPLSNEVAHFENLQSTNWNSLRFKSPPSIDSDIGWRVEFRPLDIQLTDFENSALTVFTGLMINIINEWALDFILPISLIDEGMLTC